MSNTPHDAFFKEVFGRPENAAAQFQAQLPPELVDAVDWSTLERDDERLGATNLTARYCDLLFRAKLKATKDDERDAFLFLLHDHQSKVDHRLPLRLFFYAARILESWEGEAQRRAHDPVPAIFCVVLHQGPGEWNGPHRARPALRPPALRAEGRTPIPPEPESAGR